MSKDNTEVKESDIKIINTGCCHDCGGRCTLKAHVKDGKIIRFETDNGEDPQLRACLRGRVYRQKVYHQDRLKYPMRRIGERGEGKFERITWDEAYEEVATKMKEIKEKYGNSSILFVPGAGNQGLLHGVTPVGVMLNQFGGYTRMWGIPSYEGALFASMATYGTMMTGNAREDLLNSKLIIMWGWNPANTVWDPGTPLWLAKARENGIKIINIDPIFTDSAAVLANQWIPIRPGTDAAMLNAMAYVIISENLQDQPFIDKYTVGFEKYKAHLMGYDDGIPKTPQWAEEITTVPAEIIISLAREYATNKPAALMAGWGPARTARGEIYSRAANILCTITGNIGIRGGYASGFMRAYYSRETVSSDKKKKSGPISDKEREEMKKKQTPRGNPVDWGAPPRKDSLYKLRGGTNPASTRIHFNEYYDAILQGKKGGFPADLKMAYIAAENRLNQYSNVNKGVKALKSLEFIVVHEQFMTPTAKFADILFPVNTFMERNDVAVPWLGSPYYIYLNKAIDSLYESKSDLEICKGLAKKLGIQPGLLSLTEDQILRIFTGPRKDIGSYEEMKRDGFYKVKVEEPFVAFKEQIEDPETNPFPTLSGKIEIYCDHIAELNIENMPPIPTYLSHEEHYDAPKAKEYPLQLLTPHNKRRTHSSISMIPWLEEIEPHMVWINTKDAEERGINFGDMVDVFNDRGRVRISARVTERIIPGTVAVYQGAWYNPDKDGVDLGGCGNVLTKDSYSPGGAFPMNSALVQVELFSKKQSEGS
ncbi:MAG: molybdopterin-dependent oxidoreductase [Promethearchaeota archaeon]|jgi:anaerobic dimethyl sulfoxide reductase subunit A